MSILSFIRGVESTFQSFTSSKKSSKKILADVVDTLKNKELPFKWDYQYPSNCAIGLIRQRYNSDVFGQIMIDFPETWKIRCS